jgi:hypothetical protein
MNNNTEIKYIDLKIQFKDKQTVIVSVNEQSIEVKQEFEFMYVSYCSKDTSINLVPFQTIRFTLFSEKELNQFTFSMLPFLRFHFQNGVFNIIRNDLDDL